jgi:choice-of-anchor B domain-containing protein
MPDAAQSRRPYIVVSLALTLLVALVVAPRAVAHPGAHLEDEPSPGIGVILYPDTEAETFLPGFQYAGTPEVDGTQAPIVYVGNGCSPASYAGKDVEGKIAVADNADRSTPCPPSTFFQLVQYAEQSGAIGLAYARAEPRTNGTAIQGGIPAMEIFRSDEILAAIKAAQEGTEVTAALDDTREPIASSGPAECIDGVATSDAGLFEGEMVAGTDFECSNVDLLSIVGKDVINSAGISDIWGWTDPDNGDEYVIMGKTNGTAFFNVTDPTAPLYLGEIPNRSPVQQVWHDIKVYDNHAFIVSESERHGMSVFDLTRLRGLGASDGSVTFEPDTVYELTSAAHNLEINTATGFAYIVGGNTGLVGPDQCLSGLHMVNIQDPKNPEFAGCYSAEGGPGTAARVTRQPLVMDNSPAAYVHDTTCVVYNGPDTEHHGKEICFNSAEDSIVIADVTNKRAPVTLGTVTYEHIAYAHQGSLTADQGFLLVNDELDEIAEKGEGDDVPTTRTIVLNVADLDNPALQYIHKHETESIDHNNYVHEGFAYQSNYSAGLRVLDVGAVESQLTEVGFFDTYPFHTDATFDGTWSNYPFFESGTIAISGREEGLFLVKRSDLAEEEPAVTVTCENCPVEIRPGQTGTAELAVANGDGEAVTFGDDVPAGWTVTAEPSRVSGDSAQVDVTIDVPPQTAEGTYSFTVTVGSASSPVDVVFNKGKPTDPGPPQR